MYEGIIVTDGADQQDRVAPFAHESIFIIQIIHVLFF